MTDPRRKARPVPVGRILEDVLDQLGLSERMTERRLLDAWPEIVGERIARSCRPVDLHDGVLTLGADHPVWRQELTLLMPRIKDRFNERFGSGSVREIRWDRRLPGSFKGGNRRELNRPEGLPDGEGK
jgi:predicted nucleic acid-binding Zn ribbon protein